MAQKPVLTNQQQSAFNDALLTGIQRKNMEMIKLALDNGAEPNILLFAGIHFKPTWKDKFNYDNPWQIGLDFVTTAVEYGADVKATQNDTDGNAYAALHWAYVNFNKELTDFLIEKGAPVDTPSPFGNTPLMRAVNDGHAELVEYYLSKGADAMRLCGEKQDTFPLQALESSEKFKKDKKAELTMLMMQHTKPIPAPEPAAPAAAPEQAGAALAQDIEVSHPVTLKVHPVEKPGKTFSL